MPSSKIPAEIRLHKKSASLELVYADGDSFNLPAEFLRIHSPSAEVRGHGKGQEILQIGKRYVKIKHIETVGNYAIKIVFDDGHDSGIYSWDYLREMHQQREALWRTYLDKLSQAGVSRDPLPRDTQVITIKPLTSKD
jgi:DUF971 family protein